MICGAGVFSQQLGLGSEHSLPSQRSAVGHIPVQEETGEFIVDLEGGQIVIDLHNHKSCDSYDRSESFALLTTGMAARKEYALPRLVLIIRDNSALVVSIRVCTFSCLSRLQVEVASSSVEPATSTRTIITHDRILHLAGDTITCICTSVAPCRQPLEVEV